MEFYNNPAKVDEYEKMCESYDGSGLYEVLAQYLKKDSTLLELGCGPGNDLTYLKEQYRVTGSDLSDEFLMRCKNQYKNVPFLKLDALSIDISKRFDCVFSNKVLHHLTSEQLKKSLKRQKAVIETNGVFAHTFWIGEKEFTIEGMLFLYHNREKLIDLISTYFTILKVHDYKEFEDGDSAFIIAQNNK